MLLIEKNMLANSNSKDLIDDFVSKNAGRIIFKSRVTIFFLFLDTKNLKASWGILQLRPDFACDYLKHAACIYSS